MIAKPNTLSMTLDVNEIAQYNANNVTLSLSDPQNKFLEGAPGSYFPEGYQLYGSRVVLYYGLDNTNKTALFTGVIKDLPTHKPETYQVDLKLVSPLEMLKDIEAKDFSNKVTGEELHYEHQDDDSHRIYSTAGTGVGGFDAVYADGTKLFEGVDYEVSQTNMLGVSALVTIVNDDYHNADITADYYTWKTNLTVEQIVTGLANLAGYNSGTEDIRNVVWNSAVRSEANITRFASVGYTKNGTSYDRKDDFNGGAFTYGGLFLRHSTFAANSKAEITALLAQPAGGLSGSSPYYRRTYFVGEMNSNNVAQNGVAIVFDGPVQRGEYSDEADYAIYAYKVTSGTMSDGVTLASGRLYDNTRQFKVSKTLTIERGTNSATITCDNITTTYTFANDFDFGNSNEWNEYLQGNWYTLYFTSFKMFLAENTNIYIENSGVILGAEHTGASWQQITGEFNDDNQYEMFYSLYNSTWSAPVQTSFGSAIGENADKIICSISVTSGTPNITYARIYYLASVLTLALVNLSGKTVLEALQDFALISGYEFGVNRDGVFFFRPRVQSTTPTYTLGGSEIAKVDTVKKNLSDFFTKLTLTFATVPLEFYANTGARPTPIDRYGVINKEIDKPEIVNYDNPELAQAIGPQLLEVYSAMPNVIQATGKLNLALELGDIVSLRRNYPLTADPDASDYNKYTRQDTYYRACKITGMNYNFAKRQITYTLRDVSNSNNAPQTQLYGFVYEFPIRLGAK